MLDRNTGAQERPFMNPADKPNRTLQAVDMHMRSYVASLYAVDPVLRSLPPNTKEVLLENRKALLEHSDKGGNNTPDRMLDLALKANTTPAYPTGEAHGVWWASPNEYAKAIKDNVRRYTTDGVFDKEGFAYAAGRHLIEASVKGSPASKTSQRFMDTLFLMGELGILTVEDWWQIGNRASVGGWATEAGIVLRGKITPEEMDTINKYTEDNERFVFENIRSGSDKGSLTARKNNIDSSMQWTINDFKSVYDRVH